MLRPHLGTQCRTPHLLKLDTLDYFRTGEKHSPLRLATKLDPQQHSKIVAPMRPIISQDVAVVEDFCLSHGVLIDSDFNIAGEFAPVRCNEVLVYTATGSLKIEQLGSSKTEGCLTCCRDLPAPLLALRAGCHLFLHRLFAGFPFGDPAFGVFFEGSFTAGAADVV